jgi:hypothetical protein
MTSAAQPTKTLGHSAKIQPLPFAAASLSPARKKAVGRRPLDQVAARSGHHHTVCESWHQFNTQVSPGLTRNENVHPPARERAERQLRRWGRLATDGISMGRTERQRPFYLRLRSRTLKHLDATSEINRVIA